MLSLCGKENSGMSVAMKCPYCGRVFANQPAHRKTVPHNCNGQFRKNFHNKPFLTWPDIMAGKARRITE
jgi:uncharacterized membrane protein YvbJ